MSLSISILGDVMLGENHYHFGRGIKTNFYNKYHEIISQDIKKILFNNDILLFNLECSICPGNSKVNRRSGENRKITESIYSAEKQALSIFPRSAIKVANIANNHFSQHGAISARNTKDILREKEFRIIGESPKPEVIRIGEKIIKLWGVSLIEDRLNCNEYFLSCYQKLPQELFLEPRQNGEIWIISIHWGDEYMKVPSKIQIGLAHHLCELGFDLIAGHHPHVIQSIQHYKNSIILYSLGNFIFDQNYSNKTSKGLAAIAKCNNNTGPLEMEYYVTYQKKYKVSNIENYNKILRKVSAGPLYKLRKHLNNFMMRILMKLELIYHIKEGNPQTYSYLIRRRQDS